MYKCEHLLGKSLLQCNEMPFLVKPKLFSLFTFDQDEEKIESSRIGSVDLKRRLTLITPTETIPSDVDDEQPDEDEEDGMSMNVKFCFELTLFVEQKNQTNF